MKVNLQSVNFNVDKKLVDFIQGKLDKLEVHFNRIIYADVFLRVQNTSGKENKFTEILLSVPGDEFMVKKINRTFEEGVDECVSSLERQLRKRKEKLKAHA
ncbi:ribosome hibernation-promoting factor, HPF/YfiA family [Aquimarina hainanensis]|uniref:Ribosome hibernation-promoting factor, HPF/YfiA family n=1 Tax=Aquimarina hainanensis TaxID=1578017 RepID=A0ABW5N7Y4_9FLAO|nr:ribosome-associated translation inhibitor RaiA [Aquimarina sp. TRL1]QKX05644.1 ribosome-associated translation inhibitor RaiA [Aquimarina sp. TRL1]